MNWQHGALELDAEASEPFAMAAKLKDEQRRRVLARARKGPKASDQDF